MSDTQLDPEVQTAILARADEFNRVHDEIEKIELDTRKKFDELSHRIETEETDAESARVRFHSESVKILAEAGAALSKLVGEDGIKETH